MSWTDDLHQEKDPFFFLAPDTVWVERLLGAPVLLGAGSSGSGLTGDDFVLVFGAGGSVGVDCTHHDAGSAF